MEDFPSLAFNFGITILIFHVAATCKVVCELFLQDVVTLDLGFFDFLLKYLLHGFLESGEEEVVKVPFGYCFRVFFGPIADHLLDPTGAERSISEVNTDPFLDTHNQ